MSGQTPGGTPLNLPPSMPLGEARAVMFERAKEGGVQCPCCSKHVKIYDRPFNSLMARVLIALVRWDRETPGRWQPITRLSGEVLEDHQAGDHGKLIWWGLVERPDDSAELPNGSPKVGLYRATAKGRLFAEGRATIPSRVIEYKSVPIEFYGDPITIRDALGDHFNYRELMGERRESPLMQPRALL